MGYFAAPIEETAYAKEQREEKQKIQAAEARFKIELERREWEKNPPRLIQKYVINAMVNEYYSIDRWPESLKP